MEPDTHKLMDEILLDARKNAESIIVEARKLAEKMVEEQRELAIKKAEDEVSSLLKRGENEAEYIQKTILADAYRRVNWMILSEKEHIISLVLEEVKKRLEVFAQSENYIPLLENLIVNAGSTIGGGELDVLLSERDAELSFDLKKLENTINDKIGKKTKLKVSIERIGSSGGCIVQSRDGQIIVDNTFSAILKQHEKDLRFKIAKILFSI